jgi:hypothetical protein
MDYSVNIPFINISDETIPGFALMTSEGVSNCQNTDGLLVLLMSKPTQNYHRFYYVNGPVPVPYGRYGTCSLGLHDIVLWSDPAGWTAGRTCGPKPDDWGLWLDRPGFRLLGGIDDKHALARQQEVTVVQGKATSGFYGGGLGTVQLHNSFDEDLGFNVEAIDCMIGASRAVAVNANVAISWIGGRWVLTSATPLIPSA